MIDLSEFDVPVVDDPVEQARLVAQAQAELNDTLAENGTTENGITEM